MAALLLAWPRIALACPVCYTQQDDTANTAITTGITVMLVVTAMVLSGVALFIVQLSRRAQAFARQVRAEGAGSC